MNYNNINQKSYADGYSNNKYYANKYSNNIFMNELQIPVNRDEGYIEIFVFAERGQYAIPGALVTIYARRDNNPVPIYNVSTENYPIRIALPVAHPVGTLIRGPEYYFTTYDVTVEAVGFAPYRVDNVRLFEGITTKLDINMLEVIQGQYPIPEVLVDIPPHPRDAIYGQKL